MLARRSPVMIIGRAAIILAVSGLAGAALVRFAPGFGMEEQALDIRLSAASREALENRHSSERNPLRFLVQFLRGTLQGSAGTSTVFGQPVSRLIAERAPTTLRSVAAGLMLGWAAALFFGMAAAVGRNTIIVFPGVALSGWLLSMPSAVVATVCLLLDCPPSVAVGAVVFPRVFPHVYAQFRSALTATHVTLARARGLAGTRLLAYYVLPTSIPALVALAGTSVTLAFGASIPIEALADSPGLGQLAWRAALGRDLPVLVSVTLMLTGVTIAANTLAELAVFRLERR